MSDCGGCANKNCGGNSKKKICDNDYCDTKDCDGKCCHKKCECPIDVLVNRGCQCGAIKKDKKDGQ